MFLIPSNAGLENVRALTSLDTDISEELLSYGPDMAPTWSKIQFRKSIHPMDMFLEPKPN